VIKETTGVTSLAPIVENIPEELTERPQWIAWRYEERDGKMTKVPYEPGTLCRASSTDLMTWAKFSAAVAHYKCEVRDNKDGDPGGIGFVFSSADPYVGIDIDDCRNPETGEIAPWAQEIIDRVQGGYVEISPSGRGLHIIIKGSVRDGGMRKGKVEMYGRNRFFALTGHLL
jgi:putative DNA primase/helicase